MAEYIEYLPVFGAIHDLSMDAFRRNDQKEACCYNKALNILCNAPAADVAPVVHGRWEYHDCVCTGDGLIAVYACSACQGCIDEEAFDQLHAQNYCPNCGARMDGE